jgi:hypothetical protein
MPRGAKTGMLNQFTGSYDQMRQRKILADERLALEKQRVMQAQMNALKVKSYGREEETYQNALKQREIQNQVGQAMQFGLQESGDASNYPGMTQQEIYRQATISELPQGASPATLKGFLPPEQEAVKPTEFTLETGADGKSYYVPKSPGTQPQQVQGFTPQPKKPLVSIENVGNVAPAGKTDTFTTAYDKADAAGYKSLDTNIAKSAADANVALAELDRSEYFISQMSDVSLAVPALASAKRLMKAAGVDIASIGITDDLSASEALGVITLNMTMAQVAKTKGAVSEKEMDLFKAAAVGAGKSRFGNMLMMTMARDILGRQKDINKLRIKFKREHGGRLTQGWDDYHAKWLEQNPYMTEDKIQALHKISTGQATVGQTKSGRPAVIIDGKAYEL